MPYLNVINHVIDNTISSACMLAYGPSARPTLAASASMLAHSVSRAAGGAARLRRVHGPDQAAAVAPTRHPQGTQLGARPA